MLIVISENPERMKTMKVDRAGWEENMIMDQCPWQTTLLLSYRLSEISNRIVGKILLHAIWYHRLFFFWCGVYKYCCSVYKTGRCWRRMMPPAGRQYIMDCIIPLWSHWQNDLETIKLIIVKQWSCSHHYKQHTWGMFYKAIQGDFYFIMCRKNPCNEPSSWKENKMRVYKAT